MYFDARTKGAKQAAGKLANLFGSADVKKLTPTIRALANDAMVVTVVGQTFHGRLAAAPVDQTPERQEAAVVSGASAVVVGLHAEVKGQAVAPDYATDRAVMDLVRAGGWT